MSKFLEFLSLYWKEILYVVLSLIVVVISLLKRKNINVVNQEDEIKERILLDLPHFIRLAELVILGDSQGEKKKEVVVNSVCKELKRRFKGLDTSRYIDFINENIELILSTPTKKGEFR